jgi:hypothetical protein
VTRDEFRKLFERVIENAAKNAELIFKIHKPRTFHIEIIGAGRSRRILPPDVAVNDLYINENDFWKVINVGVTEINTTYQFSIISLTVSGHEPGPLEDTWNTPPGNGPFKQVVYELKISKHLPIPQDFEKDLIR